MSGGEKSTPTNPSTQSNPEEVLKLILQNYEEVSGQKINFEKSGLFFSPNTSDADRLMFMDTFGVRQCNKVETCLGLPTHISQAKRAPFNYIKDRILKKTNGWYGKILSRAGKETLIKSVGQAIPTYAMSVFKLLPQFCSEMEVMLNKFFWNHGRRSKGLNWMRWDQLSTSKDNGGLGFMNLSLRFQPGHASKTGMEIANQ